MSNSMKKIILATILLCTSFACAQFGQPKAKIDKNDYYYHSRTGFYFTTGLTFGHTSLHHSRVYEEYSGESQDDKDYTGWHTPYTEVRIGGYYEDLASIYGAIGIGWGSGDYKYTHNYRSSRKDSDPIESSSKASASDFNILLGLGAEFYPVRNKESVLYGLFLGFGGGYTIEGVTYEEEHDDDYRYKKNTGTQGYHRFFARAEAGYDWWFSKRWRLGASFNYTFGINSDDHDEKSQYMSSYKDEESISSHTFGLTLRIAR